MNRWSSIAAAVSVVALTAGCGSSSSSSSSSSTTPSSSPSASLTAAQQAACSALLEQPQLIAQFPHDNSQPSPALIGQIQKAMQQIAAGGSGAGATAAGKVESVLKEVARTHNQKLISDDSFTANLMQASTAADGLCGFAPTAVTAMGHPGATAKDLPKLMFMGMPTTLPAGNTSIQITDKGKAPHEMIAVKLKDSFTGTKDDIKKMSDDQMRALAAGPPATILAFPGGTSDLNLSLTPGRWAFLCHFPLSNPSGAPIDKDGKVTNDPSKMIWHFQLGMLYVVSVS